MEVTISAAALRRQRAAVGGSATMRAATRVNAEQASKRVMRKPRARLPHSVNVPKRTFTPFGLLRLQNPQQRPPNGASSNEQPSEPARIVDVERQKYLTPNKVGPSRVTERPVVPGKPGNAGGGKGPRFESSA